MHRVYVRAKDAMICYSSGESMRIFTAMFTDQYCSFLFFQLRLLRNVVNGYDFVVAIVMFLCLCVKHSVCECPSCYSEQNGRAILWLYS